MNHPSPNGAGELPDVNIADFAEAAELLRALASPVRLAVVDLLRRAPSCVNDLVDTLALPQPQVSQHLRTLRAAGLVVAQRHGRKVLYELTDDHVAHIAHDAIRHAEEHP